MIYQERMSEILAIRIRKEDLKKFDEIVKAKRGTRSKILRLLIENASNQRERQ